MSVKGSLLQVRAETLLDAGPVPSLVPGRCASLVPSLANHARAQGPGWIRWFTDGSVRAVEFRSGR